MTRAAAAMAAALAALGAAQAGARTQDYPGLPACTDADGGYAEVQDGGVQESLVLFLYDAPEGGAQALVLADCATGRGLRVRTATPEASLFDARTTVLAAMGDTRAHSFGDLARQLRREGFAAARAPWPREHCVCNLVGEG